MLRSAPDATPVEVAPPDRALIIPGEHQPRRDRLAAWLRPRDTPECRSGGRSRDVAAAEVLRALPQPSTGPGIAWLSHAGHQWRSGLAPLLCLCPQRADRAISMGDGSEIPMSVDDRVSGYYGEGRWPLPYGCADMTSGQGRGCAAPTCWPLPCGCADMTSGQGQGCGEECWLRGMLFSFDAAQPFPEYIVIRYTLPVGHLHAARARIGRGKGCQPRH